MPITLLGALRDEPSAARELLVAAERRGAAELLAIRPLSRADTGLLVAACLGTQRPAEQITELAWRNTAGNPLAVEELLYHLIEVGQLHRRGENWQLLTGSAPAPPPSMLQLIGSRVGQLDELARRLVVTAALYGEQFPLATAQAALSLDEAEFLDSLHRATAAQLIVAERPGWYRFHHPLTHAAVLELDSPTDRRQAAAALAEAILADDPEPAAASCRTAARLLADAGQSARAGELYARTGKQALGNGAIEWAVADLTEAVRLQAPGRPPPSELVKELVRALFRAGQLARAQELVDRLGPPQGDYDLRQRAQLHADLAGSYQVPGRMEEAWRQLAQARSLAAGASSDLLDLYCDVTAARLNLEPYTAADPAVERMARTTIEIAEQRARNAIGAADRSMAAELGIRAWLLLLNYLQDAERYQDASQDRQRAIAFAEEFGLFLWARDLQHWAIVEQCAEEGDDLSVRAYRDHVRQQGDVMRAWSVDVILWIHDSWVSDGSLASVMAGLIECREECRRLGNLGQMHGAQGTLLVTAALRADRSTMNDLLAQADMAEPTAALAHDIGAACGFCLALEGRDGEALATLQDLDRRGLIGPYFKAFPLGLLLLLGTLAGTVSSEQISQALATASRMRWTRQFLHWSAAVHAGRCGDLDGARRHAEQAAVEAEIYPVARHLAARLVAQAATADGWGRSPIEDLRAAETWFHERGVPAAARSCRNVLRSLGVPVRQRRDGSATVPAGLRAAGITVREYEVGLLVRERLGNREIGERLHISPRTVEKHIAALLTKLGLPDRRALVSQMTDA